MVCLTCQNLVHYSGLAILQDFLYSFNSNTDLQHKVVCYGESNPEMIVAALKQGVICM